MRQAQASRSAGKFAVLALFVQFLLTHSLFAQAQAPIPRWLPVKVVELMEKMGYSDVIQEARSIKTVSPKEFVEEFVRLRPALLGGGFNGVAFDSSRGTIKFSHLAFFDPLVDPEWQTFRDLREVQSLPDALWEGRLGDGKVSVREVKVALGMLPSAQHTTPAERERVIALALDRLRGVRSTERELLGSVLWRPFDPGKHRLPPVLTEDGLACIRPFGRGVSLADILDSERKGTSLHRRYSMQKIWAIVSELQKAAERMLISFGVSIDMVVPGNIVLYGTGEEIEGAAIDPEIIEPTEETRLYYAKRGMELPRLNLLDSSKAVHWPLSPNHIVSNFHWSLTYEQSLQYLQSYWNVERTQAIEILAKTPKWNIGIFPGMNNYSNIRRARREVGCSRLLSGSRE